MKVVSVSKRSLSRFAFALFPCSPYGMLGVTYPSIAEVLFYEKCSAEASEELRILTSLLRNGLDPHICRSRIRQSASWRSIPFYFTFACIAIWGRRGQWPTKSVSFVNVYQIGRTSKIFGLNVQTKCSGTRELSILHEVSENIRDRDTQGCVYCCI